MPDQPTTGGGGDEPTGPIDDTPRAGGDNSGQDDSPLVPTDRSDSDRSDPGRVVYDDPVLDDDKSGQKTAWIILVVMIVILVSIGFIGLIWYATSSNKSTGNAKTVE